MPNRWLLAALLFASTTINYLDRQTLSVLAPFLKTEYQWSNSDFAWIVIAFRVAYAFGQTASGRMLDRLGTRTGLLIMVGFYSLAAMAASLATGLRSFAAFRFLLGLGESANWPGAAKAVSEWFPARERALAVALYDSGSAIGGAIAPVLVLWLHGAFGSWRPAFVIIGALGFLWMAIWWRLAPRTTATHAGISRTREPAAPLASLLRIPKTWGLILGRSLTDPVWFFISDWFAIYLVAKGFRLEETIAGFWVPFLAADLGNFAGGGLSSWLIARGWNVTRARKFVVTVGGLGMTLLIPTLYTSNFLAIIACFAVATFCYAALSTMMLALPADLYRSESVASVSGLTGTGAGIGTILSTFLIGAIADRYSFEPILVAASMVPLAAVAVTHLLVRDGQHEAA
jgi:ACS family hexuronate transporter-like MFS transporter